MKNVFATITAIHKVIDSARKLQAELAGHLAIMPEEVDFGQIGKYS